MKKLNQSRTDQLKDELCAAEHNLRRYIGDNRSTSAREAEVRYHEALEALEGAY